MSYLVAHLDEIETQDDGRSPYRAVRHHFGVSSFGANAWTAREAGDRVINEHDEADDGHEELYVVTHGRATFELDGERVDAPTGTYVYAPPGVKRTAFAEDAGTTILAVGGAPGKAYEPYGWELWAPLNARYQAGEHAEIVDRLRELVDANPQYGLLVYNLACLESLTGRKEEAIEHLKQAISKSERFREFAKGDTDLDAIRDEPAVQELIGD